MSWRVINIQLAARRAFARVRVPNKVILARATREALYKRSRAFNSDIKWNLILDIANFQVIGP